MTLKSCGGSLPPRTSAHVPPALDELEVSLFGPGVGECVVAHLGGGEWMIVDSCVDQLSARPVALDYLTELGLDIGSAVKLVVVTHWHDDHIQGAARVLDAASSATFWCSAALKRDEFYAMVASGSSAMMESSGVAEFREIGRILLQRAPAGARRESIGPRLAKAETVMFTRAGGMPAQVYALSPSDGAMVLSWREIARSLPQLGQPKRRAVALRPNQIAVVIWAKVGEIEVLLGADLEESSSETLGWQAIVKSTTRPGTAANIIKVPHHGSSTAYTKDLWTKLVKAEPHAVVTPFATGGRFLPSNDDLRRIREHTPEFYCTTQPGGARPTRRSGAVDSLADHVAKKRVKIRGAMGHVRIRASDGREPLSTHLCRGAFKVQ